MVVCVSTMKQRTIHSVSAKAHWPVGHHTVNHTTVRFMAKAMSLRPDSLTISYSTSFCARKDVGNGDVAYANSLCLEVNG